MIYSTTEKFLRVFGINSISDLPETESLDKLAQDEAIDKDALNAQVTMDIPPIEENDEKELPAAEDDIPASNAEGSDE